MFFVCRCPSFFNEWDHRRFEAEELLNQAQRVPTREAMELLARSCSLFSKIPLSVAKVAEICAEYRFYRYTLQQAIKKTHLLSLKSINHFIKFERGRRTFS